MPTATSRSHSNWRDWLGPPSPARAPPCAPRIRPPRTPTSPGLRSSTQGRPLPPEEGKPGRPQPWLRNRCPWAPGLSRAPQLSAPAGSPHLPSPGLQGARSPGGSRRPHAQIAALLGRGAGHPRRRPRGRRGGGGEVAGRAGRAGSPREEAGWGEWGGRRGGSRREARK
jgi:hypothetical protein